MDASGTPEGARGWLQTLLALTREGGPVSLLLVIVLGSVAIYGLVGEVKRLHTVNQALWEKLMHEQATHVEMALRCRTAAEDPPR